MGGFLNPPGHPEYAYSVESDLRRRPENRSRMSLSYAADCEWLNRDTRHQARKLLNQWSKNRPTLNDPAIQDWICNILGYFRHCYVKPYGTNRAGDLLIDANRNPLRFAHEHAGIQYIRRFYPEFHPGARHFAGAYWGERKQAKPVC